MAGGRDTARHTALLRKKQKARNLEAVKEAEERRAEAEAQAEMPPGELRRHLARKTAEARQHTREGHRVVATSGVTIFDEEAFDIEPLPDPDELFEDEPEVEEPEVEEPKMDEPHEDKMDRDGEDKSAVVFISQRAENVARELGITDDDLREYEPANSRGFAVSEVRLIREELDRG